MRFNPVVEKLSPYRASPSLRDIRREYGLDRVVRLSANEVPWGPFPEVVEALKAALSGLNRYPDVTCGELRGLVADRLGVLEERLIFGNGSCELLMLLGHAFLCPENHLVFPEPSFVLYRSLALAQAAPYTAVPLRDLEYDLEAMLAAVQENTSLLIVCNPNNPTGTYIRANDLRAFLRRVPREVVVVLDEAYVEFVTSPEREETSAWLEEHPNLVILRTFSKIYGLAGLRIGYALAHREVIEALDKVRQPFNVDSLAQTAAFESLKHPERLEERRRLVATERERLERRLQEMGIRYHPSQANFVFVEVTGLGIPGPQVPQALLERGILTRSGYAMGCPGWIRVTIGDAEEGDAFLEAMAELREKQAAAAEPRVVEGLRAENLNPES